MLFHFFAVYLELLVQVFSVIFKTIHLAQLFQKMIFQSCNILLKEQENKTEMEILFPILFCSAAASTIFLASSTINMISAVTASVSE